MNKRIAGCLVGVLGVAALVVSVLSYQQLRQLAAEGAPKPGQYPLVEWVAPELNQPTGSEGAGGAAELAMRISRRIYGMGTLGGLLVAGGVFLVAAGGAGPASRRS